ncbi:ABC-2 type transport system permease protein [Pullulanibacillus pueri]|uniref:ABC-2 type transport system permease protein n=1 Tax=Pullulanibacillus pueri TaxID=1437324 RepID=A0A8J2ZR73_9BACL|nr:ABC transporter permease [Pullulanibacillus pueri]MBM7680027.1 ABC-2 type transport system permease protein [Pullulanibacillus pueri]GGH74006.1 hypothetical protein GCM10007096_01810 [Pullulanibacillus pueri]
MFKFIKLVQNENMKTFRRVSSIVMLAILLCALGGVGAINKHYDTKDGKQTWQQQLQAENQTLEKQLKEHPNNSMKETLAINTYRLDHNIKPQDRSTSFWGNIADDAANGMQLVMIFAIIIAGGIVSSEFGSGTIKLLLTRPVSRSTILLSKYVSTLFTILVYTFACFIFSCLVSATFFGLDGLSSPYLFYQDGAVHEGNMLLHVFGQYGFQLIPTVMFVTLAFLISTVFRNSALAIGLSIFGLMAGSLVLQFIGRFTWSKYVIFSNLDLTPYFHGGGEPFREGMTLGFSITVLAIYYMVFIAITWISFKKRDVTA